MDFTEQQVTQALIKYNNSEDYHFWKDSSNVFRMLNNTLAHDLGYKSTDISFDGVTDYDHNCRIVELADDFVCRDKHVLSKPKKVTTKPAILL